MITMRFGAAAAALLTVSAPALSTTAMAAPIIGLYNTGVDATGAVKANGSAEEHYNLIVSQATFAVRTATSANGFPIPPWVGDNATSSWVGPNTDSTLSAPVGQYIYQTTFSLANLKASTASITGRWSVDDQGGDIRLNGRSLGIVNNNGFTSFTGFDITSGFVDGINTLDFVVNNSGGGPTGLRVELSGTAQAVPEPAAWALMVLGFGAIGAAMRRRTLTVRYA